MPGVYKPAPISAEDWLATQEGWDVPPSGPGSALKPLLHWIVTDWPMPTPVVGEAWPFKIWKGGQSAPQKELALIAHRSTTHKILRLKSLGLDAAVIFIEVIMNDTLPEKKICLFMMAFGKIRNQKRETGVANTCSLQAKELLATTN